ncbi:hypothetical protein VHEMI07184 [[Torrubiella] hemipterigena]|uniref:Uncharacterized protein n=1 Tax=[Torrubiella] hemipterigena TaxID=1531966 RepID=A0A0A1T9J6_9HYPO|nr:hypothetical protein VHEMI07184 [[Torrubiella] hemipterigena]
MDPLSIIASTIAVVQATAATYKAIQKFKGLPKEFVEVSLRFPLAEDSLRLLQNQLNNTGNLDDASKRALEPCINGCYAKAQKLRDIFKSVEQGATNDGSVLDIYRAALMRLGKVHRVERLMNSILADLNALATNRIFQGDDTSHLAAQLKESIDQLSDLASSVPDAELEGPQSLNQLIEPGGTGYQAQYNNYGSGPNYNISGGSHTMNFGPSRKSRILEALNTLPYRARMNRNPDRTPRTCEWFEDHPEFKQWDACQSSSMLWISANPGCGKSVLAKYLVQSVLPKHKSRTVCYFFFKDDFLDQRGAAGAICCILHKLFTDRPKLFSEDIAYRLDAHRAHLANSFNEVWDALVAASKHENAHEIVCVLDAFDECADDERHMLSRALRSFYDPESEAKRGSTLKFLITSRPYDKIRRGFLPFDTPGLSVVHLRGESDEEVAKIAREINIYIKSKVSEMDDFLPEERQLLLQRLQEIPNRTYLWVYLAIEWIRDVKIHSADALDITSALPTTVDQAYEKILAKSIDQKEARKLLHIVVATTRPLTMFEMDSALHIGPEKSPIIIHRPWDRSRRDRCEKYIRNLCGLFVNIVDSKVYLLHQTAKEFLVTKADADSNKGSHGPSALTWKSSFDPQESQSIVYNICLWRLFDEGGASNSGKKGDLFEYCAINWAIHFRNAYNKHNTSAIESARQLCITSQPLFDHWFGIYWKATQVGNAPKFNDIMVASFFGLEQVLKLQLSSGNADVNVKDSIYGRSSLSWAAENGFDNVAKLLLKGPKLEFRRAITKPLTLRGAKVNTRDVNNRTPLSYAAWNGHLSVVRRLVQEGADVNTEDDINASPLYYALCTGRMDVVNEMSMGYSMSEAQAVRNNLLLSAAETGQERVIKMLLETGVDLETTNSRHQTPLLVAIHERRLGVARLLLDKGANVKAKDNMGRLPLHWAVVCRDQSLVEVLLKRRADTETINSKDNSGRTALSFAAERGFNDIIETFIRYGANVEALEADGCTALFEAARHGHNITIHLLVNHGANVDSRDTNGHTPLLGSIWGRHASTARILIGYGATVNSRDKSERTALSWAAENGFDDVMETLIKHGADVEARETNGRTALFTAALHAQLTSIHLLLSHGANIDPRDDTGRTPLSWVVERGDIDIIRILIGYGAALDSRDNSGQTPLAWAKAYKQQGVLQEFLKQGA